MKKLVLLTIFLIGKTIYAQTFNFSNINFPDSTIQPVIPFADFKDGTNDLGDIDNDGDLDIVVSRSYDEQKLVIFTNDGNGNFTQTQEFHISLYDPTYVKFADIDNDGDLDIIQTIKDTFLAQDMHIYTNDGAGNFTLSVQHSVATNGLFYIADIDQDGYVDMLTTNHNGKIVIFLNNHQGSFDFNNSINTNIQVLQGLFDIIDFNNDNYPDLYANAGYNDTKIWINNQNNTFTEQLLIFTDTNNLGTYTYGGQQAIKLADLDNDQIPEFIAVNRDYINVFQLQYNYQFNAVYSYINPELSNETVDIKVADFNNDGLMDFVSIGNYLQSTVYINNGNFQFNRIKLDGIKTNDNNNVKTVTSIGDINGDNYNDIITTQHKASHLFINQNGSTFQNTGTLKVEARSGYICKGDADGDGNDDLLVVGINTELTPSAKIYKNTGNGYSSMPLAVFEGVEEDAKARFFDADNDGDADVIITGNQSTDRFLFYYQNDGSGHFTQSDNGLPHYLAQYSGTSPTNFYATDIDNDNDIDVILEDNGLKIYRNDGNGNFIIDAGQNFQNPYSQDFQVIDINNDGYPDIYYNGYLFTNDGTGYFTSQEVPLQSDLSYYQNIFFFIDLNNDTYQDLVFLESDNLHSAVYINDGQGNLIKDDTNTSTQSFDINNDLEGFSHYQSIDFDNDGDQDLMIVTNKSYTPYKLLFLNINGVLYKLNDNTFTQTTGQNKSNNFLALDYNNDGLYDLIEPGTDHKLHLSINNGYNPNLSYIPLSIDEINYCFDSGNTTASIDFNYITDTYFNNFSPNDVNYFLTLSDAQNQQNPLPANFNYTLSGNNIFDIYIRANTNPAYIISTQIHLRENPDFDFINGEICDTYSDQTEQINLNNYFTIYNYTNNWNRKFYLSQSDAENDINGFYDSHLDINAGITEVWCAVTPQQNTYCRVIKQATFYLKDCSDFQYEVNQEPFQIHQSTQPTNHINLIDDVYSQGISLDYSFDFFGDKHNNFAIGNNGNITFNQDDYNHFCPWNISSTPIPDSVFPKNNIFGVYQDIAEVTQNGSITYTSSGFAPFKRELINYTDVPVYDNNSNSNITMTSQIILYETYNIVDVQVQHREPYPNHNNGNGILGIQNQDATLGYAPPNRNTGPWTANEEAWRFKPVTDFPDYQFILCDTNLDGTESFDLDQIINNYSGFTSVSLHLSYLDAINNTNSVNGLYNNTNNAQSLYIRLDNGTNVEIRRIILAVIDCSADYDFDTVPTTTEDLNINGNYGDDDTDSDGLPDFVDDDDDGDMILTINELTVPRPNNRTVNTYADTDGDGIPNYLDNDDDGDGTLTIDEDYNGNGNPADDDINNNGIPDYLDNQVTSNITMLPDTSISIYPIPSKNLLHIDFNINITEAKMKLFTQDGKMILQQNLNKHKNTITLPETQGIYYLKITTDKGEMYKPVIKK